MKYEKTKYPNIFAYETKSGKRYSIRRGYFFEGSKKEFSKSGLKTIAEAKNALTQFELDLQANSTLKLIGQKMTINEFWDKFSENKIKTGQWTADSETTYANVYNNVLMPKWGDTKLINLNRQDFENWSVEQLKTYSRSSVKSHYILLKAIINDAIYNGYIDRNPIQRIHIGKSNKEVRNTNMNLSDYSKWMDTAERILTSYEFTMVYLTIFGLRRGEVMGLKKSSVKLLKDGKIQLTISDSRTINAPKGKGTTKTGKSRIDVLDDKGSVLIQNAIATVKDIKGLKNQVLHQDDYLFVNPATAKPYHVTKLNKLFLDVNRISGIHAFPHMMRHFFATQAIAAGVSIEHVAEYLGHSTTYMTEKYKEVTNEVASQVIDLYEKRIKRAE